MLVVIFSPLQASDEQPNDVLYAEIDNYDHPLTNKNGLGASISSAALEDEVQYSELTAPPAPVLVEADRVEVNRDHEVAGKI